MKINMTQTRGVKDARHSHPQRGAIHHTAGALAAAQKGFGPSCEATNTANIKRCDQTRRFLFLPRNLISSPEISTRSQPSSQKMGANGREQRRVMLVSER